MLIYFVHVYRIIDCDDNKITISDKEKGIAIKDLFESNENSVIKSIKKITDPIYGECIIALKSKYL